MSSSRPTTPKERSSRPPRPTTPSEAGGLGARAPLPTSLSAVSLSGPRTPGGLPSGGAAARREVARPRSNLARRRDRTPVPKLSDLNINSAPVHTSQHELATQLWQTDQKLVACQGRLTSANLELNRRRAAAEQHTQELNYVRRQLEREQRERSVVDAELTAAKRAAGMAVGATAGGGERELVLRAQVEEAQERAKHFSSENERLQDEISRLTRAVEAKGDAGAAALEASRLREERQSLALELHNQKQVAAHARVEADEAKRAMAAIDGLRASLREGERALGAARSEVESLSAERAAMLQEHAALLSQAQSMASELEAVRLSHSQVSEQKLAVIERLNSTEHALSALRAELAKREEDFQVDIGLFAQRDMEQRALLAQRQAEAAEAATKIRELEAGLEERRAYSAELALEVEQLQRSSEESQQHAQEASASQRQASARAEVAEVELRRDRAAYSSHAEVAEGKHRMLATRLESALRELQDSLAERDRMGAMLEEALSRCTGSLVAKQLAEDESRALAAQLDAIRTQMVS